MATYDTLQVDIGNAPNDDQGDPLRTAFDKINQRFAELRVFLRNRGDWAPNTVYTANPNRDWVIVNGVGYLATSNHTSGATFAADLAAGKWVNADAIQLRADLGQPDGAKHVGGVDLQLADYTALRAYAGTKNRVYITGALGTSKPAGIAGVFQHDPSDTTSADNGGTIIVGSDGRRWKRDFDGTANVFWFMTEAQSRDVMAGTLTQNVRSAIQASFNASKRVYLPSGTYWMGAFSLSENIIDLSNAGNGVSIVTDKSVELVCQSTASGVVPRFFYMLGNSHFNCGSIRFRDTGYDPMVNWRGAIGFFLDNNTSNNWCDVTFESIYGRNLVSVVTASGGGASNRIRGIRIGQLFSDDCYYGFNSQNQGDGVQIDNLIAFKNYRPYFVYGVVDHKVKIFNRTNRSTSGAVNISRNPGGLNTKGIDVTYVARDQDQGITHVLLNHIDLLGGVISNVKVRVDIESSVIYTPVRFVNYSGSGGSETTAASSNSVYDVELSGSCDVQASPVSVVASYATKGNLTFNRGQIFNFDNSVLAAFRLDQANRAQAVTWTASGSPPSIGNGTLYADHDVVGGLCTCTITLTMGSTTTFGTGEWSFGLPYTPTTNAVGSVFILDAGAAYYTGVCRVQAGGNQVFMFANGAGTGFNSGNPIAWAANDQIRATITFPIS